MKTTIKDFTSFGKISKAILFILFAGLFAFSASAATVTTDHLDYSPCDVVTITGSGFLPGETVTLQIVHQPASPHDAAAEHQPWTVVADGNGNFVATWLVPCDGSDLYATLLLTAIGQTSGLTASATFTDAGTFDTIDFHQASNQNHPTTAISWINGILNPNNSDYTEGMAVPQRVVFTGIVATTGNTHTLTFGHQAVKGGVRAYDFLISWPQAVQTAADLLNNPVNELQNLIAQKCNPALSAPAIPACNTNANYFQVPIPDDNMLPEPTTITCQNPPNPVAPVIALWEAQYGNRYIELYGNSAITTATLTFTGYTNGQGDSYANYTLTWTSTSTTMVILMAGRSAQSCVGSPPCFGYGPGCGAGSINGGPYPFKLYDFDGHTTGNQDNQVLASALAPAPTCTDVTITGPQTVCPNTTNNIYTSSILSSVCGGVTHSWSIAGFGTIIGSTTGASINVTASICGQFSICDTIRCEEGTVICCYPVNVTDNTAPVFGSCPSGANLGCNPSVIPSCINVSVPSASDNCGIPAVTCFAANVVNTSTCGRSRTIAWTATDVCGNSSTCQRTWTWTEDTSSPVFTSCPPGSDLGVNPIVPSCANQSAPTATDDCSTPTVTCTTGSIINTSATGRSRTISWTASDACANSSVCSTTWTWTEIVLPQCGNFIGLAFIDTNSTGNIYSVNISGSCTNATHSWSISGNGFIVGSSTGSLVSITAGNVGQITLYDTITCDEGQIICSQTIYVVDAALQCDSISGSSPIGTNSTGNIYTMNYSGTCSNVLHNWSISGNGAIVGSVNNSSVNVTTGLFGPFTIKDSVVCDEGYIVCSRIIDVFDTPSQWLVQTTNVNEKLSNIQFTTNTTGYAAGSFPDNPPYSSSRIIKTTDGGVNWNPVYTSFTDYVTDFSFATKTKKYAVTSGSAILKSMVSNSDSLIFVSTVPALNVTTLKFINNNTGFAGDDQGNVYKTTDGGITWSNPNYVGVTGVLESFSFFNNNIGIVVGHGSGTISKTTDGGNNWIPYLPGYDLNSVVTKPGGTAYAVGDSGIVIKSTDYGSNWSLLTVPIPTMNFNSAFIATNNVIYAVGDYGAIIKTIDGGMTWQQQTSSIAVDLNSIYCINASTCFVSGNDGHVLKTTTGGNRIDIAISDFESGDGFVFYPNPAYDVLNFVFDENINHSINISNTLGQIVLQTETEQQKISLEVKQLPKGVYFISIKMRGEYFVMKKFIKM